MIGVDVEDSRVFRGGSMNIDCELVVSLLHEVLGG